MVSDDMMAVGVELLFRTVLVFGMYLTIFFAIGETAMFSFDLNGFLDQYGPMFVAATAIIQLFNLVLETYLH
jgi:hypothetical protein